MFLMDLLELSITMAAVASLWQQQQAAVASLRASPAAALK
jgi:hypothetical protein